MITKRLAFQVLVITLGPFQFGLHMAELNALLPFMDCAKTSDCIDVGDGAFVSSIYAVGGFLGSLTAGPIADRVGRKGTFQYGSLALLLGSIIMVLARTSGTLALGRFIAGLAAGQAIVIGPLFISEISPPSDRGKLGATSQISVNVGILCTQFFGWLWATQSWRRVLALGVVSAAIQFLALLKSVESPVWLRSVRRVPEEIEASSHLGISRSDLAELQQEESVSGGASIRSYITKKIYRKSFFTAAGIMVLQQFTGINAIIFFGVSILQQAAPTHSVAINLGIAVVNLVVTCLAAYPIDKLGRKPLLIGSLLGIACGTFGMGYGLNRDSALVGGLSAILVVVAFASGMGPIPFLLISEITPRDAQGAAQSVGTTFNWIATFIIGEFFPLVKSILGYNVFYLFSSFCLCGAFMIYTYIQETSFR